LQAEFLLGLGPETAPLAPPQVGPVGVPPKICNLWTTYDFAIAGIKGFRAKRRLLLLRQVFCQHHE
jgi:hypothetical protein